MPRRLFLIDVGITLSLLLLFRSLLLTNGAGPGLIVSLDDSLARVCVAREVKDLEGMGGLVGMGEVVREWLSASRPMLLTLGRTGRRPLVLRLAGRGVSALLSLLRSAFAFEHGARL